MTFLSKSKERHEHKFDTIGFQTVLGDDNDEYRRHNSDCKYTGPPMALLYYICKCGYKKAFDYGKHKIMVEKAKELSDVPPTKLPATNEQLNLP